MSPLSLAGPQKSSRFAPSAPTASGARPRTASPSLGSARGAGAAAPLRSARGGASPQERRQSVTSARGASGVGGMGGSSPASGAGAPAAAAPKPGKLAADARKQLDPLRNWLLSGVAEELIEVLTNSIAEAKMCGIDPDKQPGKLRDVAEVQACLQKADFLGKAAGLVCHAASPAAARLEAETPFTLERVSDPAVRKSIEAALAAETTMNSGAKQVGAAACSRALRALAHTLCAVHGSVWQRVARGKSSVHASECVGHVRD